MQVTSNGSQSYLCKHSFLRLDKIIQINSSERALFIFLMDNPSQPSFKHFTGVK